MPMSCSAYGCTNRWKTNGGIAFHRFPLSNKKLLQQWVLAVRRKSWYPTVHSFICSDHFTPDSYKSVNGHHLKPDAVPSIFNFSYSQTTKKKKSETAMPPSPAENNCGSNSDFLDSSDSSDEAADYSNVSPIEYPADKFQPSTSGFYSERISSIEQSDTADGTHPDLLTCSVTNSEENVCVSRPIILNLASCSTVTKNKCLPNESSTTISDNSTGNETSSEGVSVNSKGLKRSSSKEELRRKIRILQDRLRRREKRIENLKSALRQVVEIRKSGLN